MEEEEKESERRGAFGTTERLTLSPIRTTLPFRHYSAHHGRTSQLLKELLAKWSLMPILYIILISDMNKFPYSNLVNVDGVIQRPTLVWQFH